MQLAAETENNIKSYLIVEENMVKIEERSKCEPPFGPGRVVLH